MAVTVIPCLECSTAFERNSRHPTRYCLSCRRNRKNQRDSDRRRLVDEDRRLVREVAERLREHVPVDMYMRVDEYIQAIGANKGERLALANARPSLAGAETNAGPDEGTSTGHGDLAGELEARRMAVIMHDWFVENPHWSVGFNASPN